MNDQETVRDLSMNDQDCLSDFVVNTQNIARDSSANDEVNFRDLLTVDAQSTASRDTRYLLSGHQ